jgi:hypothetical protein
MTRLQRLVMEAAPGPHLAPPLVGMIQCSLKCVI